MIGDDGPDFSLTGADGALFHLHSLKGRQASAVLFLQRAERYLEAYASVGDSLGAQNIRLIFICQQRLPKLEKGWSGIVIAHDRQGDVARLYGALNLISGDTVPAVYLLDAAGKLRYYAVGRLPSPAELQAITVAVLAPETLE
jgi:peroxiredoxin